VRKELLSKMFLVAGLSLSVTSPVFAVSSANHVATVSDLMFPLINFSLYLALMVKLLAKPLSVQLQLRKDNMESFIKRAAMQWDQARRHLLDVQRRFNNLETELKEIASRIENEGAKEATQMVMDAEVQAKAIIKRAEQSAIAEANALEAEIRHDLAQEVIRIASEKLAKEINSDSDLPLRQRALEGLSGVRN
jgi:F-type H+-transporting ATPase subunit b